MHRRKKESPPQKKNSSFSSTSDSGFILLFVIFFDSKIHVRRQHHVMHAKLCLEHVFVHLMLYRQPITFSRGVCSFLRLWLQRPTLVCRGIIPQTAKRNAGGFVGSPPFVRRDGGAFHLAPVAVQMGPPRKKIIPLRTHGRTSLRTHGRICLRTHGKSSLRKPKLISWYFW